MEGERGRGGDTGRWRCSVSGRVRRPWVQAWSRSGQRDRELRRGAAQVAGVGGKFARIGGRCFSVGGGDDKRHPVVDGVRQRHLLRQQEQQCQEQRDELTHSQAESITQGG